MSIHKDELIYDRGLLNHYHFSSNLGELSTLLAGNPNLENRVKDFAKVAFTHNIYHNSKK
jgi:type II secretory pathway predicted ATPase ExeA